VQWCSGAVCAHLNLSSSPKWNAAPAAAIAITGTSTPAAILPPLDEPLVPGEGGGGKLGGVGKGGVGGMGVGYG
jgi:hypothetical protein